MDRTKTAMDRTKTMSRPLYGVDYEEFISRLCLACIRMGTATREGLRERGYSDEAIDLGTTELLSRGFLVRSDEPDSWGVVPPRESFPQFLEWMEHRAALTRAAVAELDNEWRRAVGRETSEAQPDLDVLSSIPQVIERIVTMHRTARERLWWALGSSAVSLELLTAALEDEQLLAVADGVDVRVVLDTAVLDESWAPAYLERWTNLGYAVRVGHGVPFGVVVCDEESALVEISAHDPDGYGSLAVRRKPARAAVIRLFEQMWALSTPFGPTARRMRATGEEPVAPLDDRDARVLALLSTGASDKVIARQVGASVRTVERRVRYLMEHLGAATRFQAGVQAARRGWV